MTIPEPPIHSDDTQPNQITEPIQPTISPTDKSSGSVLPSWMLLGLILLALTSLVGTLALTLSGNNAIEENLETIDISLRVAGIQTELTTTLVTVGDVLAQEQVTIGENDAVSPAPSTALSDGMVITVARARTVTLILDGDGQTIETPHENPNLILQQANITVDDDDFIWLDGTLATPAEMALWGVPVLEIEIDFAHQVTIIADDSERQVVTTAETVADVLYNEGITVYLSDTVSPDLTTSIDSDLVVQIERARPVVIQVDDVEIETRVQGNTVADALSEAGIALVGLDYTIPELDAVITSDTVISVLRVTEGIETTDTVIPYDVAFQADSTLEIDNQRVIQAGQNGIERLTEQIRYENGVEVSREPMGVETIQSVQNQIIGYGTNIVLRTIDTPEGPREYWRVIRAYATSYHPAALGGDNVTAIGATLQYGIIAADPDIIPYRTDLFVPGYGVGMMADTGGPRSSPYWVDLGYSDEDWVSWSRYVDVYLLTPVPSDIDYILPNFTSMRGIPDN